MKRALPFHPQDHPSFQLHRRQRWTQILLPVLLAGLLFIGGFAALGLAAVRGQGDLGRWAAVSTMWLLLPVLFAGLLALVILSAGIYLLARLTPLIPPYSYQAQRWTYRITGGIKRGAELARRPVQLVRVLGSQIKSLLAPK